MSVLKVYDGSNWVTTGVPSVGRLNRTLQLFGDFRGLWNVSANWILLNTAQAPDTYPSGITIKSWSLDCSTAAPTTQIAGDLKYCDAVAGGAFPGANATLIKAIDSTTGNSGETGVSYSVPAGKILYLAFDADPTDYNTTWNLVVNYVVN
jgi:hypothetical protein